MKRPSLAYVVQLDLPGGPIKVGHSTSPRNRFKAFDIGTPCDARLIGVTFAGQRREAEMLAATEGRKIKGEWRYPTQELYRLLAAYHEAGEWFTAVADPAEHIKRTAVADRVKAILPNCSYSFSVGSVGYWWAANILAQVTRSDPMLHLDWAGFVPADVPPSLQWPVAARQAA